MKNAEQALEIARSIALQGLQTAGSKCFEGLDALDEPILDAIRDEPALEIVRQNVATRVKENREKVLTLICDNNPVPDYWRRLEARCADR